MDRYNGVTQMTVFKIVQVLGSCCIPHIQELHGYFFESHGEFKLPDNVFDTRYQSRYLDTFRQPLNTYIPY